MKRMGIKVAFTMGILTSLGFLSACNATGPGVDVADGGNTAAQDSDGGASDAGGSVTASDAGTEGRPMPRHPMMQGFKPATRMQGFKARMRGFKPRTQAATPDPQLALMEDKHPMPEARSTLVDAGVAVDVDAGQDAGEPTETDAGAAAFDAGPSGEIDVGAFSLVTYNVAGLLLVESV